jgi:hypothetical protein
MYEDLEFLESYGLCTNERKKWTISFDERFENDSIREYILKKLKLEEIQKIELNNKIFT